MAGIDNFVNKQKEGARFVITAQMLRLSAQDFDALAQTWIDEGGPGFSVASVPHRSVINGEFFISRVTVTKNAVPT